MKKLNNLGFTLIELLAVITIMGILMMVAIPSVSRTIENARRDTFADNVKTYINTVRNAVLADELECKVAKEGITPVVYDYVTISAMPNGTYYFKINTSDNQTMDLMEKVAKSSWGNAELKGYVKWVKATSGATGESERTRTTYYARLGDTGKHGMSEEIEEKNIKRSSIKTADVDQVESPTGAVECTLK